MIFLQFKISRTTEWVDFRIERRVRVAGKKSEGEGEEKREREREKLWEWFRAKKWRRDRQRAALKYESTALKIEELENWTGQLA